MAIVITEFLTSQLWLGNIHLSRDQAQWSYLQFKKFHTIEYVPRITDFCSCIYVLGCRLSLVRLCDSDFGIIPVDDITIGITCAAFCFHISHISFTSSWYLFCLSVIVLARLCLCGTAMSISYYHYYYYYYYNLKHDCRRIVACCVKKEPHSQCVRSA